jgi:hypothetical protein
MIWLDLSPPPVELSLRPGGGIESDPYKVSPDAIADIEVSETWVAGERKFAA